MRNHPTLDRAALDQIAAIAHRLWCERMKSEGWRYGDRACLEDQTHDALVPFERLSEADRIAARRAIQCMELDDKLVGEISYARGPNRDYVLADMKVGLRVVFCPEFREPAMDEVPSNEKGEVESWECVDNELESIVVRWADGSCGEYPANSGELARLDELT